MISSTFMLYALYFILYTRDSTIFYLLISSTCDPVILTITSKTPAMHKECNTFLLYSLSRSLSTNLWLGLSPSWLVTSIIWINTCDSFYQKIIIKTDSDRVYHYWKMGMVSAGTGL